MGRELIILLGLLAVAALIFYCNGKGTMRPPPMSSGLYTAPVTIPQYTSNFGVRSDKAPAPLPLLVPAVLQPNVM